MGRLLSYVKDDEIRNKECLKNTLCESCKDLIPIEVYIQPFYNIQNDNICGAELLVRGQNISASGVIDEYRKAEKLQDLDLYMIEQAAIISREIKSMVNVNISGYSLLLKDTAYKVSSLIQDYNAKALIMIEINEDSDFDNNIVNANIKEFVSNGLLLSLDDFNFMKNGFEVLSKYPVKQVKIKQTKLGEFTEQKLVVLKHMLELTKELGVTLVIEGIETKSQLEDLYNLGFESIQGYIISEPIPYKLFTETFVTK